MAVDERYEDFYVGKVEDNPTPEVCSAKPGDYVLFHAINGISDPYIGVSYDFLVGYLSGALNRKSKDKVTLTNGITEQGRDGWFPKIKIKPLEPIDLERILKNANLHRKFSINDFR